MAVELLAVNSAANGGSVSLAPATPATLALAVVGNRVANTSAVTYGGVAMTLLRSANSAGSTYTSLWYLFNPPTGTASAAATGGNDTTIVAYSFAGTYTTLAQAFHGGAAAGAAGTSGGNSTSLALACSPGDFVVDGRGHNRLNATLNNTTPGSTKRAVVSASGGVHTLGSSTVLATSTTQTMTWTSGNNDAWSSVAVAIKDAEVPFAAFGIPI